MYILIPLAEHKPVNLQAKLTECIDVCSSVRITNGVITRDGIERELRHRNIAEADEVADNIVKYLKKHKFVWNY